MGVDELAREHVVSEESCPVEGLGRQSGGKGAPGQQGALGRAGRGGRTSIAVHTADTGLGSTH